MVQGKSSRKNLFSCKNTPKLFFLKRRKPFLTQRFEKLYVPSCTCNTKNSGLYGCKWPFFFNVVSESLFSFDLAGFNNRTPIFLNWLSLNCWMLSKDIVTVDIGINPYRTTNLSLRTNVVGEEGCVPDIVSGIKYFNIFSHYFGISSTVFDKL